jgi:hypothetical protein
VILLRQQSRSWGSRAYALLLVMVFTAVTLLALGTALNWTSSQAAMDERKGRFQQTQAAASAAAAKVAGTMVRDFQEEGVATVSSQLDRYRGLLPTPKEHPVWSGYSFSDNRGQRERAYVRQLAGWEYDQLLSLPGDATGWRARYEIEVQARERNHPQPTAAAVRQQLEVATIPLFQFAVFYDPDLELNASERMTIAGRVHANSNIYSQPEGRLTFAGPVSAAGAIQTTKHPQDPVERDTPKVEFDDARAEKLFSLSFALDARQDARGLRRILEPASSSDLSRSDFARKSFFNRADLIVIFTDTGTQCYSGSYNKFGTTVAWSLVQPFLGDTSTMYDWRENRYALVRELDMKELEDQQSKLAAVLGRNVSVLYVADQRAAPASSFRALRVVNGNYLPATGLTLATPNPLYVKGDFNTGNPRLKPSQRKPVPACLAADAITVLSDRWNDSNSWWDLYRRHADDTTINAAILTGIVPTGGGYYSGGLENVLRLLEDWNNDNLNFKGSIAVLFASQVARGPWGASPYVYRPADRKWNFAAGFENLGALPPATPDVMVVSPGKPQLISASQKP